MGRKRELKEYGKRIRVYRKAKKLTIAELAVKIRISQGGLSDIENEKIGPSGDTLLSLIENTDINPGWLMTGWGEMMHTPVAPAIEVIGRIIRALYARRYVAWAKRGVPSTVLFSRYIDKVEKELGLVPGIFSLSRLNDPAADLPHDTIVRFCAKRGISLDYIYFGKGEAYIAEQPKQPCIDLEFMGEVTETMWKCSQKEELHLSPKKAGELAMFLYDDLVDDPKRKSLLKGKVIKFAKIVS
jgi:transcriptional regulator with XRE-family HTH domain